MSGNVTALLVVFGALFAVVWSSAAEATSRIKDITTIRGVRANQLVGYGLVIGLKGTGDSLRNAPFTDLSMRSMLERLGVNLRGQNARTNNVAAVMVTAELPPFGAKGSRIDINVSSLGDATSLAGGTLVMTPLYGADNEIYAVAQGSVLVSGFSAAGDNESLTHGVPTSGRISGGAIIERNAPGHLRALEHIFFDLRNPDFATAIAIADAINAFLRSDGGRRGARVDGPGSVVVHAGRSGPNRPNDLAQLIAAIGALKVRPDTPARIVVDERTGTIVIGRDVRVSRVAVAHGNLTVRITETPEVSQPLPFSDGETVVTTTTVVEAGQDEGHLATVEGVDLQTLVSGLNQLGLKPPGIIAILQAVKSAGALQAELVVQ